MIVKICKIHGQLTLEQTRKHKRYRKRGGQDYFICRQCWNGYQEKYRKKNPLEYNEHCKQIQSKPDAKIKKHISRLKRERGITPEQYNELLIKQNEVCAICKQKQSGKRKLRLAVDHCHETGKIRGLLCNRCNLSIGALNDSVELLSAAIQYLTS